MSEVQANLTLRQRRRLQQSDAASESEPRPKRKYLRAIFAVGLLVLLAAGAAWAWMYFNRGNNAQFKEILALQAKADKLDNPISPEAIDLYKQMHEKMKDLPDDLKKQVFDNGMNSMRGRANRFFASSSKDQLAILDMFILAMQAKQLKDALTGQQANSGSGNSGGGHGRWGGSDTQHMQHMQKMLSNLSPQQRAQWGLGRQMFNARLQQQGGTVPSGGIF